jgi:hypothetical protein
VFATELPPHVNGDPVDTDGEVALILNAMVSLLARRSGLELAVRLMMFPRREIVQLRPEEETMVAEPRPVNADGTVSVIQPITPVPVLVAVNVYVCVSLVPVVVGDTVNVQEVASQNETSACRPEDCPSAVAVSSAPSSS